eukprot:SAG25_NODE_368_length_9082_cov_5.789937_8_plen_205_part_00
MAAAAILLPLLLVAAAEPARNRSVLRVDLPHTNTSQLSKLIDAGEALWGHRSGSAAEILVTDATQHRELARLAARTGAKLSVVIGDVDDVIRSQKAARKGDGWHPRAANSSAERAARRDEYFLEYLGGGGGGGGGGDGARDHCMKRRARHSVCVGPARVDGAAPACLDENDGTTPNSNSVTTTSCLSPAHRHPLARATLTICVD